MPHSSDKNTFLIGREATNIKIPREKVSEITHKSRSFVHVATTPWLGIVNKRIISSAISKSEVLLPYDNDADRIKKMKEIARFVLGPWEQRPSEIFAPVAKIDVVDEHTKRPKIEAILDDSVGHIAQDRQRSFDRLELATGVHIKPRQFIPGCTLIIGSRGIEEFRDYVKLVEPFVPEEVNLGELQHSPDLEPSPEQ